MLFVKRGVRGHRSAITYRTWAGPGAPAPRSERSRRECELPPKTFPGKAARSAEKIFFGKLCGNIFRVFEIFLICFNLLQFFNVFKILLISSKMRLKVL